MALDSRLWQTLTADLLNLVFARLPVAKIVQLRALSKEWKENVDCQDSEFNRVVNSTAALERFALMSWDDDNQSSVSLHNVQNDEWDAFDAFGELVKFPGVSKTSMADGGLFCIPWRLWDPDVGHMQLVVVNPLTRTMMKLPTLLRTTGEGDSVEVKMAQLTMDRNTKEYQLHVVCHMEDEDDIELFAQAYDFRKKEWSMVESREGRIFGWEQSEPFNIHGPCVYNYADRSLQRVFSWDIDIAPGLEIAEDESCIELIHDRLFVLHQEAPPPSSTNLVQDHGDGGEGVKSEKKYCISEFRLPEGASAWVKLREHECDPSIYSTPNKNYRLSLMACNGFLAVRSMLYDRDYDHLWLYNLSTRVWRKLPNLETDSDRYNQAVLCEINWNALP